MTVTTVPSTHPIARRGPLSQASTAELHQSSDLQYQRREAHIPKGSNEEEQHYILTLLTDKRHHDEMTALRRQWFPSRLLKVDAHITLFHALPGSKLSEVKADITNVAARTARFPIAVGNQDVYEMGKGVGIQLYAGQKRALSIRSELRGKWEPFLSDQDRREKWRGHYTVMNKQDDKEEVQKCLEYLKDGHIDSKGTVEGLSLWLYDRGWWQENEVFKFSG
ncbi:2'-5' RNA ligase superfamily-domain-containing protein [Fusarium redolens]|uniref:2'-5' RNA ligase superfamily-domain-containing protein n=1 Tax=Fusarium redolens TaxID=48865 RepID=A0A9P9GBV6_FUSRE|nr:2'-5' RNA ligase superfamily-domain-containing protein [Fusarium redolens]KAH7236718.1 2'-5' RNA ligase superfamily-domain-containing protein [Fusarium redolens]